MATLDGLLGVLPALHLHEGTLAELGPALGPAFAPVVVVVPVVAGSFMCRSRRRCGPCKRNLAGAGEHGAVALVALPVQLRGAEAAAGGVGGGHGMLCHGCCCIPLSRFDCYNR